MSNPSYAPRTRAATLTPPLSSAPISILIGILSDVFTRVAALLRAYVRGRAERRRARKTVQSLMALSNRELKDIGVNRGEILSLAYGPDDGRKARRHAQD